MNAGWHDENLSDKEVFVSHSFKLILDTITHMLKYLSDFTIISKWKVFFWWLLKAPPVNLRALAFSVLKCNCRTENDNFGYNIVDIRDEI